MILYRIEPASKKFSMDFVPYIPYTALYKENKSIKRICVAKSIKDCICSAPYSYRGDGVPFYSLFRVFEFEIDENDKDFIDTKKLKDKVPDIEWGSECWITKPISASKIYYISGISDNNGMGISYQKVNESEIFSIIDISFLKSPKDLEEIDIKYILENGFDDYNKLISDYEVKDNKIFINSKFLFWGEKFKENLKEEASYL